MNEDDATKRKASLTILENTKQKILELQNKIDVQEAEIKDLKSDLQRD